MSNDNAEPNIFHFATKELSQDAFLCWLLSWANKNYNQTETKDFYNFAQLFIQKTTGRNDLTLHKISRQEKHIDILLELKDTKGNLYAIVIEDKVFTQEHDQQIERYVKEIKNIASDNIYIMYFKTGFTSEQKKEDYIMLIKIFIYVGMMKYIVYLKSTQIIICLINGSQNIPKIMNK